MRPAAAMDSPYRRFNSYDFESDARFQDGLKKVPNKDSLELKIFYYNRFIEPVDLIGFQEWRDGQQDLQTASSGDTTVTMDTSCVKDNLWQGSNSCGSEERTQSNKELVPEQGGPLSFAEVFRMIQAGEEIPGLQKLDIKPSNQQPTVSQMLRKLKPWEK
ncbi:uncharacterized protein LOC108442406 [Pygocentrus nattereri]|uniref:uncharacterized protein LOC108442406 n=1 Tax=Pygocentrus nattereri TaxID=42514 RepID=UPI0008145D66|nr:uncharacterized protein LOC108442406 [Pygocentrus nattereri]